jgi:uncharacterized membrane protein YgaE (UPF0421/DUF939 family)
MTNDTKQRILDCLLATAIGIGLAAVIVYG